MGCWWEAVPTPLPLFRLTLDRNDGVERFYDVQPGCHFGQYARETQVVLWGRLGWCGEVDVCPTLETDTRSLVRAKEEKIHDDLWIFYGNSLEEGQDVVAIVCDGVQRLGGGLL